MEKKQKSRGLKLSFFNTGIVLVSCVLYLFLLGSIYVVSKNYEQLVFAADTYIQLEDAAKEVLRASDYLTEQVRLYTQTLDPQYARLYFKEVNITRRRDAALELMSEHSIDVSREDSLKRAIETSDELTTREIIAIALIASAQGHEQEDLSVQLDDSILEESAKNLASAQKINKARAMLFDQYYQDRKNKIQTNLDYFTRGVLNTTQTHLVGGLSSLSRSIRNQRLLLTALIALNCITFFVITLLVVKPLKIFLRCVKERDLFQITGTYEFRCLAREYNDIYMRSDALAASEAFLRTKAERDALTGTFNRYMFQQVSDLLRDSDAPLGLILLDVDKFKTVNDTYGHTAGDDVLVRVAQALTACFRDSDYVFRIGGDEFSAILPSINPESLERIREKILEINQGLLHPADEEIPVSLSVGVAFSPAGYHDNLFEQADRALYLVKQNGRNGCMIYTENMTVQ